MDCAVVDGVEIDEAELNSMEEMMREASSKHEPDPHMLSSHRTSEAMPITRHSLAALTGDENDLLADSPVF